MIKRLIILLFLASVSYTSQSQILISLLFGDKLNSPGVEFGLEGGLTYASISGFETSNYVGDFYLGFYFDIRLEEPKWWLSTGLILKNSLGVDKLTATDLVFLKTDTFPEEGDYSQRIKYYQLPVSLKYRFKSSIYVEMGFQAALRRRATFVQFDSNIDGQERKIRTSNKDDVNPVDFGGLIGVGYTFFKGSGLTFALKYYYGFTNVYKGIDGRRNSAFYVQFNVPIGAGKKNIKQNE